MSLLKSSVNYVPTGKGKGTAAARALRANVRRVRADNTQRMQKRDRERLAALQREMNRANRLQQQRDADRTATLIGKAALQRQKGKVQRNKIAALIKRKAVLRNTIAGHLRKSMESAFQKKSKAQEALDRATEDYEHSVEMMKDAQRELGTLPERLELAQAELGDLKRNYDDMPPAAKLKKSFEADLAKDGK